MAGDDWIKLDLHIHTHDDPRDALDYSAHQLLERAKALNFDVLAITLHDAVFDRPDVFRHASELGILLIPSAELRILGGDVILLNVTHDEIAGIRNFDNLRQLRAKRGDSLFTIVPHPFYVLGGSIGERMLQEMDCFDAIEVCHFHKGIFNPNRRAEREAAKFGKPLIATSDAHRLSAFGSHYTSIPRPEALTIDAVFAALRSGPLRLTSPPATIRDIVSSFYFIFIEHPRRLRGRGSSHAHCAHS